MTQIALRKESFLFTVEGISKLWWYVGDVCVLNAWRLHLSTSFVILCRCFTWHFLLSPGDVISRSLVYCEINCNSGPRVYFFLKSSFPLSSSPSHCHSPNREDSNSEVIRQ